MSKFFKKYIRYPFEGILMVVIFPLVCILPFSWTSALFGVLTSAFGRFSKISRRAVKNYQMFFPRATQQEAALLVDKVWNNFGRSIGEYHKLRLYNVYESERFEVQGVEHIDRLIEDGKPGIIFSAHLASWEPAIMAATQRGLKLSQLYRTLNNPYVDKIVRWGQERIGQEVLTKGSKDGRRLVQVLKEGGHLFMLVDQKMNNGIAVPFMGRLAMTPPAPARLALKFDCPLVPARVERIDGKARFRITYYPPLSYERTGDLNRDVYQIMKQVNETIEGWIRERPEQWLWLHQRWPKPGDALYEDFLKEYDSI